MSRENMLTSAGKEVVVMLGGIVGNNCGIVEPYVGIDKRLQKKGYTVANGIPTLRGYAKISDLAAISHAKYSNYQREKNEAHVNAIRSFLNIGKDEAKFLPEVILSIDNPQKVVLNKFQHKSITSTIGKGAVANLDYYILKIEGCPLSRVDGNHRLEAGANSDYYVPFSIILWNVDFNRESDLIPSELNQTNTESEAFLFYFLNNTAKKLELEENYKGLVLSTNWTDEELSKVDVALPLLRRFYQKWLSPNIFNCPYLDIFPLAQMGKVLNEIYTIEKISEIETDVFDNIIHETVDILKQRTQLLYIKENFRSIVAQLVFYTIFNKFEDENPEKTMAKINAWCEKYKYNDELFFSAKKLYDIAISQIRKKEISVFVAMPFYNDNIVRYYNDIFCSACTRINEEGSSIEIHTYPIMTFKGKTFDIESDIMKKINSCGIFVADISQSNPNVMYELGMAAKAGKPVIILKKSRDKAKIPSDIVLKFQVRFSECMDLRDKIYDHLKTILQDDFLAVFPK